MFLKKMAFENIVGKGENAGNQYPTMFFSPSENNKFIFFNTFILFSVDAFNLDKSPFENIVEKGEENASNQHFLLFPQCFLPF